jgi:predicted nucleic acid-binding protein
MIRAVLDTNVLLSALRSRNGASFEILSRFADNQFVMVIGNTVLSEYD